MIIYRTVDEIQLFEYLNFGVISFYKKKKANCTSGSAQTMASFQYCYDYVSNGDPDSRKFLNTFIKSQGLKFTLKKQLLIPLENG